MRKAILAFALLLLCGCFARTSMILITGEPKPGSNVPQKATLIKMSQWAGNSTAPIKSIKHNATETVITFGVN